jgi:hypothetical protein
MSDRELMYLTDFAALMATRKYEKVPSGHPFGSQLGVHFDHWDFRKMVAASSDHRWTKVVSIASINCD